MKYKFGPWTPDLPSMVVGGDGLLVARNVVPRKAGYGPLPGFEAGAYGYLDQRPRGHIAALANNGIPHNFAGDANCLYHLGSYTLSDPVGTIVDASGGLYTMAEKDGWEFVRFGNSVFAVTPDHEIQYYNMQSSTVFADITDDRSSPKARHVGVLGSHMIVGNTYDVRDGKVPGRIWWPAIGNPFSWPIPGTDNAMIAQSGYQDLEGEGGEVMGVTSGAEVSAIFQEGQVSRMQYIGGDLMFAIDAVETDRGLLIPGLAIPRGREVLYLAEDGWHIFDYTQSHPVGEDVINRTFFADLDSSYLGRLSWTTDPKLPLSYILYPGSGNVSGTPNKMLIFNWVTRAFADAAPGNLEMVCQMMPPVASLDADPQVEDLDAVDPYTSFDDRESAYNARVFAGYNTSNILGTFSGANLTGRLDHGDLELAAGRRSHLSEVRPLVQGSSATVQVIGLDTQEETAVDADYGAVSRQARDGACKFRVDARYHRIRTNLPAGFTSAIGVDVHSMPTGVY